MNNLVDLKLDNSITREQFDSRKQKLEKDIAKKQKEREAIAGEIQTEEEVSRRLERFKDIFNGKIVLDSFDREVFECLIDKIIIGEKQKDGTYNPYIIRFICKGDQNSPTMFLSDKQDEGSMSLTDTPHILNALLHLY